MTSTAGAPVAEERSWNFEHKGDEPEATLGKDVFRVHGMVEMLQKAVARCMQMFAERGPDPDVEGESDLERGIRIGSLLGDYREGPRGDSPWSKWMVTVCGMLAVGGVGAVVGMYGKLSTIEANQNNQGQQISDLKDQISEMRRAMVTRP